MRTFVLYALARLGVFAICFAVLWLFFGAATSVWLIALLALLFTSGFALLLLRKQGADAGAAVVGSVRSARSRFERRVDTARAKEDED